jgi:ribonuclease HI
MPTLNPLAPKPRTEPNDVVVNTNGTSRGNPGTAGIGVVVERPAGTVIRRIARGIGRRTPNQAAYEAVIAGLRAAHELTDRRVLLLLDSDIVARTLRGENKLRDVELDGLYKAAMAMIRQFDDVVIRTISSQQNSAAERLASEGIEKGLPGL